MKEDDLGAVKWIHGAPDCTRSDDPPLAVHRFDRDTFILRVSKCFSFEGNFLYLLCGRQRAILFDTGGPADPGSPFAVLPLRATVDAILAGWLEQRGQAEIELVVAHTHGHGDHVFWDGQFADRPRTRIVAPALDAVQQFFGLQEWPEGEAEFDLGGRILTIFPIPGHEPSHLAIYDPGTRILLTGDLRARPQMGEVGADLRRAGKLEKSAAKAGGVSPGSRYPGCGVRSRDRETFLGPCRQRVRWPANASCPASPGIPSS